MKIKEQIANFFTLMNLVCGFLAILCIGNQELFAASLFVFAGAFFDFCDGFVARALRITSELGKQLDSLSDVVTFGVVPGLIAHELLTLTHSEIVFLHESISSRGYLPWIGLIAMLIPTFSALRLAKFNIDATQSKNFRGLPTPANGLLWASFGILKARGVDFTLFESLTNPFLFGIRSILSQVTFLVPAIIIMSLLLVAPINLMGLKFDKFTWRGNEMKFLLVIIAAALLLTLGFVAVPIILLLYILFSIIHFYILKRHEIQS